MKILTAVVLFCVMCLGSCNSRDELIKVKPCNLSDTISSEVSNTTGTIGYHTSLERYFICVIPEGHIDTVIYGFLCTTPEELKKPGLKVIFNGKYSELRDKIPVTIGGHEYHNLNLTAYKVTGSN